MELFCGINISIREKILASDQEFIKAICTIFSKTIFLKLMDHVDLKISAELSEVFQEADDNFSKLFNMLLEHTKQNIEEEKNEDK